MPQGDLPWQAGRAHGGPILRAGAAGVPLALGRIGGHDRHELGDGVLVSIFPDGAVFACAINVRGELHFSGAMCSQWRATEAKLDHVSMAVNPRPGEWLCDSRAAAKIQSISEMFIAAPGDAPHRIPTPGGARSPAPSPLFGFARARLSRLDTRAVHCKVKSHERFCSRLGRGRVSLQSAIAPHASSPKAHTPREMMLLTSAPHVCTYCVWLQLSLDNTLSAPISVSTWRCYAAGTNPIRCAPPAHSNCTPTHPHFLLYALCTSRAHPTTAHRRTSPTATPTARSVL